MPETMTPAALAEYRREYEAWLDARDRADRDPNDRLTVAAYRAEIARLTATQQTAKAA